MPLIPSSNRRYTESIFNSHLSSMISAGCELTVMRDQQVITFHEPRTIVPDTDVLISSSPFHPISPDIYYINIDKLKTEDMPGILDSLNSRSLKSLFYATA